MRSSSHSPRRQLRESTRPGCLIDIPAPRQGQSSSCLQSSFLCCQGSGTASHSGSFSARCFSPLLSFLQLFLWAPCPGWVGILEFRSPGWGRASHPSRGSQKGVQELSGTAGEAGEALPACPRVVCAPPEPRERIFHSPQHGCSPRIDTTLDISAAELPPQPLVLLHPTQLPVPPGLSRWEDLPWSCTAGSEPAGRAAPALSGTSQKPKSPREKPWSPGKGCTTQGNPAQSRAGASGCAGDINPK